MTTLTLPSLSFFLFKNNEQCYITQKCNSQDFLKFLEHNPDERFELIDGMIIPMSNASPRHGKIISNFARIIAKYLVDNGSPCFYFSHM